jgi:hypothetical protein
VIAGLSAPFRFTQINVIMPMIVLGQSSFVRHSKIECRMSALGRRSSLSALPPKADIVRHGCNVRFVPKADIAKLSERLREAVIRSVELIVQPDADDVALIMCHRLDSESRSNRKLRNRSR